MQPRFGHQIEQGRGGDEVAIGKQPRVIDGAEIPLTRLHMTLESLAADDEAGVLGGDLIAT
jgi:hypothetical protein